MAKLLCRLYEPQAGTIEADGIDLRELHLDSWRERVTAVFQDFVRFELPLRDNVAPGGAPEASIQAALADARAENTADLDTILARGYDGARISPAANGSAWRWRGPWPPCARAPASSCSTNPRPNSMCVARPRSSNRILQATRDVTTILISHRFSTVRHADRICVLEQGRVVELGTHDELMALAGRYRTMFDLQAQRFESEGDDAVAAGAPVADTGKP